MYYVFSDSDVGVLWNSAETKLFLKITTLTAWRGATPGGGNTAGLMLGKYYNYESTGASPLPKASF